MATLTQSFLQGEIVEEKYTLMRYLGGSDHSAVFQTQYGGVHPRDAAIKLLPAPPGNAEARLSGWRLAANISHPHLMRIIDMGRCELANAPMLFVVTELANENLGQVLPERPLTAVEAQDMLASLLDALVFLHNRGFVHGHIRPSNIMVVGNDLKLSSDRICRLGEPVDNGGASSIYDAPEGNKGGASSKADIWSLGATIVEALTQQRLESNSASRRDPLLPETLPAGFAEIARHCLRCAPNKRWTAASVQLHLPKATAKPVSSRAAEGIAQAGPHVRDAIVRTAHEIPQIAHKFPDAIHTLTRKIREASRAMAPVAQKLLRVGPLIVRRVQNVRMPEIRLPNARRYATGAAVLGVAVVAIAAGVKFVGHGSPAATPSHEAAAAAVGKPVQPVEHSKLRTARRGLETATRREHVQSAERLSAAPQHSAPKTQSVDASVKPSVSNVAPVLPAQPPAVPGSSGTSSSGAANGAIAGRVIQRVLPDVPRAASNTIWGTVRVAVRVAVDSAGNVTQAELEAAGPSKYFARLSLAAAHQWHFAAPVENGAPVASVWLLHFGYQRGGTGVEPSQVQP
jgi:outer membrane biosynthesis protein TonB